MFESFYWNIDITLQTLDQEFSAHHKLFLFDNLFIQSIRATEKMVCCAIAAGLQVRYYYGYNELFTITTVYVQLPVDVQTANSRTREPSLDQILVSFREFGI